jgi:hypothetical protein
MKLSFIFLDLFKLQKRESRKRGDQTSREQSRRFVFFQHFSFKIHRDSNDPEAGECFPVIIILSLEVVPSDLRLLLIMVFKIQLLSSQTAIFYVDAVT